MYRRAAIVTVVSCHLLVGYYAWLGARSWTWAALIIGVLAGHLLLDGLTILIHWTLDNYMSPRTPLIGPVIAFFREHHVDQRALFARDYFESNFENALIGVVVLLGFLPFSLPAWACIMLSFAGFGSAYVTQIHKWAHNPVQAWPVQLLQRSRLIIDPVFHDHHHRDASRNYGLYAGWLDRLFDWARLFECLEVALFVATGAVAIETRLHLASPGEVLGVRARLRRTFWRLWYGFLSNYAARKGAQFSCMNWGYADTESDAQPALEGDPERYPLQLYDALCSRSIAELHTIADLSCGRGGGIAYLHRRYRPRRAIGIDLVEANLQACRAQFRQEGLTFLRASAEALPFTDGELDVAISVEASHCYGSLERFLAEAHRALVPGGELLWTDFAPASELENRREMVRRFFEVVEDRDITPNVLLAMRLDAERRVSLIRGSASPVLHRVLLNFAAAGEDQRSYKDFAEGRDRYFLFRLRKPR